MPVLLPYFVSFTVTLATILLLRPLAIRLGLLDEPGGRKVHKGNVPLIGGLAIFLGVCFALLTVEISLSHYRCLIAGIALLVVTGLLDDLHELTPRARLFVQILVAILMTLWGKNSLQSLGDLFFFGEVKLGYFAVPLTVFSTLVLINATNMLDGMDGLAGSVSCVEFFYLSLLCQYQPTLVADQQIIHIVLCALLAFLCFNFPFRAKASVFMGDSGSTMLGFLLAWFCIDLSQAPHFAARPVAFLWIMAVPLLDIGCVVFRRLIKGSSPFTADRKHLHYFLLSRNFSVLQVTIILSFLSALSGMIGLLGERYHLSESIMLGSFASLFLMPFILSKLIKP